MNLTTLFSILKGGPNSGNIGHAGRPGKRGGSAPSRITALISELMVNQIGPLNDEAIDKALRKVFKEKGFDKPPILVKDLVKERGDVSIFRGVTEGAEQFKKGELFVGEGVFGSGSYFSTDKTRAESYAPGTEGKGVINAILPKSAKIIDWEDLRKLKNKSPVEIKIDRMTEKAFKLYDEGHDKEANKLQRQASQLRREKEQEMAASRVFDSEPSLLAAHLGYDAIHKKRNDNEDYYLVLNRSILQVEE